jgi:hypothetical protein
MSTDMSPHKLGADSRLVCVDMLHIVDESYDVLSFRKTASLVLCAKPKTRR